MCGICGVIGGDPRQVEPAVRRMMRAMIHRGPDDAGYEQFAPGDPDGEPVAGFGFRRLSILDLSEAGHQPMVHPVTGDCLIFNGEIYNFRALRNELQAQGVVFRGGSDTEVLLNALVTWGEAAVHKLHGMFAFAFYQAGDKRILIARDPLGIKPLYVANMPDRIVFASEVRALLASGIVPTDLDPGGIAGMLAYGAVQSPRTVHAHIRSFPAGCTQWIDVLGRPRPRRSALRRFWDFPGVACGDDAVTAARTVESLLRDSVFRHLVADVPVGVFLSAGIDSTIIASFAREYTPRVTAFTVGFGGMTLDDERKQAAVTAEELGIKHVSVQIDPTLLPEKWHDWLENMDSPSVDGFNTYLVSRRLAREGVVVGLSGLGADELFGGYPCFERAPRWSRWLACLPLPFRRALAGGLSPIGHQADRVAKVIDLCGGDATVAGVARSLRRVLSNREMAALGITPSPLGLGQDYLEMPSGRIETRIDGDDFNAVSRSEMTHYMTDTLLRDTDGNSMRHSLEARLPFLDLPLVDYVSSLPGTVKRATGGLTKTLLRQACPARLTTPVATRPKTGFTLPIGAWMRGPMRDACVAAVDSLAQVPGFDESAVRRGWMRFVSDSGAIHWTRPLALVVLGQYLSNVKRFERAGGERCAVSQG